MTIYVRKIDCAATTVPADRLTKLVSELTEDAFRDELSVFRIDDVSELPRIATLYNAGRAFRADFGYVLIPETLLATHGATCHPDEGRSPFKYLRDHHCTLKGLRDVHAFAKDINESAASISKKQVVAAVRAERVALTITTPDEWERTAEWTRAQ